MTVARSPVQQGRGARCIGVDAGALTIDRREFILRSGNIRIDRLAEPAHDLPVCCGRVFCEEHQGEIVSGSGMAGLGRAPEMPARIAAQSSVLRCSRVGCGVFERYLAKSDLAKSEFRMRVTKAGCEGIPFTRPFEVARQAEAVPIELPDQGHGRRVCGIILKTLGGSEKGGQVEAALIGAVGEIPLSPVIFPCPCAIAVRLCRHRQQVVITGTGTCRRSGLGRGHSFSR